MSMQRSALRANALSESARTGHSGCLVIFGAIFLAVGCVGVTMFLAAPLWRAYAARDWVEVPCTIRESRVGRNNDDGEGYRVEVRYEYRYAAGGEAGARRYESDRYDFSNGVYTSGRKGKQAVVDRLRPGTKTTCRVNPRRPDEAVLKAGLPSTIWLALLTLLFPLAGAAAIAFGIRGMRRERARREGRLPRSADARPPAAGAGPPDDMQGPCVLEPAVSRRGKAIGLSLAALLWNGIVWTIFFALIVPDVRGGLFGWFEVLFFSVFLLVGLFIAGAAIHAVLALANPRIRLTLNRRAVRPGERIEVQWECEGNASRIDTLTIAVEGREEATYTRGTTTSTDKRIFARIPVKTAEGVRDIETGRTALAMPADAAPTFEAPHNKLRWQLAVRGVIRHWPDIDDAYDLLVLPAGKEGSR